MRIGPPGARNGAPPTLVESSDGFLLANDAVKVHIDRRGVVTSLIDRHACREIIAEDAPSAVVQVFQDSPTQYDAWDIERHDRSVCEELFELDDIVPFEPGTNAVGVRVVRRFGTSRITQDFVVSQNDRGFRIVLEVDWKERRRLLKLALPFDVHATHVASEIQFGHVHRPVHRNTSWDAARFEVCAHRWIHVGEPGFGVAVCSDSTYGHDAYSTPKPGGGITTTIRPSLVRGTEFPDPHADIGTHRFQFDIRTGAEIGDAINTGYAVHLPLRSLTGASPVEPLVERSGDDAVIIESVKLAEDRSGDVVLRLYESRGGRATSQLSLSFNTSCVVETDLLERPIDRAQAIRELGSRTIDLELRPFQIVTLRLGLEPGPP